MTWNFIDDYTGNRYYEAAGSTFDMDELKLDQHFLTVSSADAELNVDIYLYSLNKECIECPYLDESTRNLIFATNLKYRIATEYQSYFPQDTKNNVICDLDPNFGQFGVYNIEVNKTACSINVLKEPVNIYSPILTVLLIYIALFGVVYGLCWAWKKIINKNQLSKETKNGNSAIKKERVMSIDTFRGISIVIMIFANYGDGDYLFIGHTVWNGLHIADLVFPWFMWIMGACIPISLASSFKKNVPKKTLLINIFKRSFKLFCLGMFVGAGCNVTYMRIFGVLQRFGVCYFIVTTLCIFLTRREIDLSHNSRLKKVEDILKLAYGWIIVLALVTFHTTLIFSVHDPGCPRGYMGPGGLHKNRSHEKCIGGATGYIDSLILGKHLYQYPTIWGVFGSAPFDPEGIVGCLTTILQVFLGVQAGTILMVYKNHSDRIIRWLIWAVVTGIIGGGLCCFSKEDGLIPVNKNLWSLSFVMVTSCFAFFLLSFCYFLIDVKKFWSGKPFLFAGMNAILLYVGHEICDGHFPIRWYFNDSLYASWRRTHFVALLSDVWGAGFWVLVSYYMYKLNYFFTV